MGSVMENAELAVEKMRKEGKKVGIVRIRCYRPFPFEVVKAFAGKKVVVFEKAVSMGADAPLYAELCAAAKEKGIDCEISTVMGGLGGKDVTVADIEGMFKSAENGPVREVWGE
jgi:pyruvate ferredoxin oxidoreductase alpha subunit